MAYEPPPFMPYEPFLLGVGVVFNLLIFAYSWKLPAYSGAFLLTVDNFSFFTYSWSFLVYSGKVHLIRGLRGCKQRS